MGAEAFWTRASGNTPEKAFYNAQDTARYRHGHEGYTGTIAEKESWMFLDIKERNRGAEEFAAKLLDDDDERVCEKWGPCGCVLISENEERMDLQGAVTVTNVYLFFGWASC